MRAADDSAWVALARFLLLTGQTERIDSVLAETAAGIPPANRPLVMARCYEAAEQHAKAEQQYKLAYQDSAAVPNTLVQSAGFYIRTGRPAEAEPLLRKLLKNSAADSPTVASGSSQPGHDSRCHWRLQRISTVRRN